MLAVHDTKAFEAPDCKPAAEARGTARSETPVCVPVRILATGETLFHEGDMRTDLYRVESGAICHYMRWPDGRHDVIEFAFPGDIIGFGNLVAHISSAQAMVDTELSFVTADELDAALATDGRLSMRFTAATDREFDFLRTKTVQSTAGKPVARVASLLLALYQIDVREGRDALVVPEDVTSGFVAESVGLSIDGLAAVLKTLETRGLVSVTPDGLRLDDIDGLERLADAA